MQELQLILAFTQAEVNMDCVLLKEIHFDFVSELSVPVDFGSAIRRMHN
jgi:hypothetical protein